MAMDYYKNGDEPEEVNIKTIKTKYGCAGA